MIRSILPGSNRASTANRGSPVELLPPVELQNWVGNSRKVQGSWPMNSWVIWLTYVACSQVMQCSTLVVAQGGSLCRSPAT